jgi:hypothetical protein
MDLKNEQDQNRSIDKDDQWSYYICKTCNEKDLIKYANGKNHLKR